MVTKGYQTKFGFGLETTFGVAVEVDEMIKFIDTDLKPIVEKEDDNQICATPDFQDKQAGISSAGGTSNHNLDYEGYEKLFEGAFGDRVSVDNLDGTFTHTFTFTQEVTKSFTVAIDKINAVWEFPGQKISALTMSAEAGRRFDISFDWIGNSFNIPAVENTPFPTLAFPAAPYFHMNKSNHGIGMRTDVSIIDTPPKTITMSSSVVDDIYISGLYIMVFIDGEMAGKVKITDLTGSVITYTGVISPITGTNYQVWQLFPVSSMEFKLDNKLSGDISASGDNFVLEPEREDKREVTGSLEMPKYYTDILTYHYINDSYAPVLFYNSNVDFEMKLYMKDCRNLELGADIAGQGLLNDVFNFKAFAYTDATPITEFFIKNKHSV